MLLQKSKETLNGYILTHEEAGIVIRFLAHRFNETQQVTLLDDCETDSATLAHALREMGDWIVENHPDKVFPPDPETVHEQNRAMRRRIGALLREARIAQGLTVRGLEDISGVNKAQISRIEAGRLNAGIDSINALASVLGLTLSLE